MLQDLQPERIMTLCGSGGIGKSALAAEAIWHLTKDNQPPQHFPDGVIYHYFYQQKQVEKALKHIALSFREEPRPTPLDAARGALSRHTALILFDGTEEADDLRTAWSIVGNCGVIVTSRQRRDALEARQDIDPLQPDEAMELLRAWGGDQATDREFGPDELSGSDQLDWDLRRPRWYAAQRRMASSGSHELTPFGRIP